MLGGDGRPACAGGGPVDVARSDSEKNQRLGEFGARGIRWEPLEHGADPVAPIRRAVVVREPGQVHGGPQSKDQGSLGQADLHGGDQILDHLVHPVGVGACVDLCSEAQEVRLMDQLP